MSADFLPGNALQLLFTGADYFPALIAAIDDARHEVHLESYIFDDDAIGKRVAAALARAARRGVAAHVLADGFGARRLAGTLGASMTRDGVQLLLYRPRPRQWRFHWHRLRRLHRKLVVIDGRIAFVGGINITTDFDAHFSVPRFDYAVRIEGPVVEKIHATVRHVWQIVRWSQFGHRPDAPTFMPSPPQAAGDVRAALVIRDNLRHRRDIEEVYFHAMNGAKKSILLANAYFLPGRRFRDALTKAAERGVQVTLLLQGRTDYVLQHHATLALYDCLLSAGVKIFEYQPSYLHAKVAVVDDTWVTVGSSNIDPFSLLRSREANLIAQDQTFARTLAAHLQQAIQQQAQAIRSPAQHQSRLMRKINSAAYAIVRILVNVTGYGRQHDSHYADE
jgi:cardiolipin synthase